ncbi:MAG TPA: metallophosphoesterase, partial [Pyrinomonadaceae bacterium]|nr:metallophosphoesterase [Pyrinomonadaceae bacterium]
NHETHESPRNKQNQILSVKQLICAKKKADGTHPSTGMVIAQTATVMKYVKHRYNFLIVLLLWVANAGGQTVPADLPSPLTLPLRAGSTRLLVFGDSGRGSKEQYELSRMMFTYHRAFPFDTALMTGDNIYGGDSAADMKKKFEDAYRPLLDAGVKFYASLGNHDDIDQRAYPLFNMNGSTFYRIEKNGVSMYALDSNRLDAAQLEWLKTNLAADKNNWRIAFFHHPPYSSSETHGSESTARRLLEPIFLAGGIDVVFNGHDHVYERIKPQKGIQYFVTGAGGRIRNGDVQRSELTAAAFDTDLSFMLVEITGDELYLQVISRDGRTVDSGVVKRRD